MTCPHCGARVPRGARACRECGSDEETGWKSDEDIDHEAADIPDAYDPDRWEKEGQAREEKEGRKVAIVVLIILGLLGVLGALLGRR